jgi:predicted NACHT family NTPase
LAELLKHCGVEEFDRLEFAHAQTKRRSGLEAVDEFDKLMLLGKPGAGKTTFLKRLAVLCNAATFQGHRVPIFITLKDFEDSSSKPNLLIYISQRLKELGISRSQEIEQILNQGRCFLLLDGLDEVSERKSKQMLREIQAFSDRFSQNAFVISCRIAAKEFTFQQFTEVEVADFNDEQIADFATGWFQAKQLSGKTERFLEKLKNHPRIKELATNPLLLTLLCLVFEGRTDFPANRSELYEEGLDVLLKKWDGTRSIEREQVYRELSLKRKEDLLSQIAFTTFESGNYFFKQKNAERLIESYIQNLPGAKVDPEALWLDSEAVLKSIEAQHGLLVEQARDIYSFSHLTFHEYFTARWIEKRDEFYPVLLSHLTERRWREVVLLTVGMVENAESLLLMMKSQIDGMLATDQKLQQFLTWVQQKSCSAKTFYKLAALRAFYFARGFALSRNIDLTLEIDRDLAVAIDLDGNIDYETDCTIDYAIDHDRCLASDLSPDFSIYSTIDLSIDCALTRAQALARARARAIHLRPDRNVDTANAIIRALDTTHACTDDTVLQQALEELKNQLPTLKENLDSFLQWWWSNGPPWIVRLRAITIEHRNIGHNWEFSDAQQEQLRQYYNANGLLVDCLNSDCYVSREVREQIEGSLLLPVKSQE